MFSCFCSLSLAGRSERPVFFRAERGAVEFGIIEGMANIAFVVARCAKTQTGFAIRFERQPDSSWFATKTSSLQEQATAREGYGATNIDGAMYIAADYTGCPACKAQSYFKCGQCGRVNCWDSMMKVVTCGWCGGSCTIEGSIKDLKAASDL